MRCGGVIYIFVLCPTKFFAEINLFFIPKEINRAEPKYPPPPQLMLLLRPQLYMATLWKMSGKYYVGKKMQHYPNRFVDNEDTFVH